jgi:hypothetical protein
MANALALVDVLSRVHNLTGLEKQFPVHTFYYTKPFIMIYNDLNVVNFVSLKHY